jgi:glycosyltransferase involved in cell wall biosynthesis
LAVTLLAAERDGDLHFLWAGAGEEREIVRARHDIRAAGLASKVTLLGPVEDPRPLYAAMDVFALTSREDPFPLVCLEAAAAGKPIVCFDGAGGIDEFVGRDGGFVVPYLDLAAMAERLRGLLDDEGLRRRMGERNRRHVLESYTLGVIAPKLVAAIENAIASRPRSASDQG